MTNNINDEKEFTAVTEALMSFFRLEYEGALEITKLTLKHCKIENLDEQKVSNIFQNAMTMIQKSAKGSYSTSLQNLEVSVE